MHIYSSPSSLWCDVCLRWLCWQHNKALPLLAGWLLQICSVAEDEGRHASKSHIYCLIARVIKTLPHILGAMLYVVEGRYYYTEQGSREEVEGKATTLYPGDMLQNDPLTKCVLILFPRGTQKFSLPLTTHHRTSQAQLKCPQQRTQYREKSLKQKQKRRNKIVVSYCKQKLQKVSYLVLLYYFFNTQHPKMNKRRPVPGSWETNAAMEKETMIP